MKIFDAGVGTVLLRYYLMMAFVFVVVFSGLYWLLPIGMVIFLWAMLGVTFKKK